jgi:hypothetical protein
MIDAVLNVAVFAALVLCIAAFMTLTGYGSLRSRERLGVCRAEQSE